VNYILHLWPPVFFRGVQSAPQLCWTMWFPWGQVMCHVHLVGLQIYPSRTGSALAGHR
jgi:hypothetical protein